MKMSDGPTTESEIEIAASAEAVWAVIADLQTPARTSSEFQGAQWLDGATEPAVGARFVGRNRHEAIGEWETTSYVTIARRPHEFQYAVMSVEDPAAVWTYQIEPREDGVLLRQIGQVGPGRNGLTPAIERMPEKEERILTRRLAEHRANMSANLAEIKRLAEAAAE